MLCCWEERSNRGKSCGLPDAARSHVRQHIDIADTVQVCSGAGLCNMTAGGCSCFAGYTGKHCELCGRGFRRDRTTRLCQPAMHVCAAAPEDAALRDDGGYGETQSGAYGLLDRALAPAAAPTPAEAWSWQDAQGPSITHVTQPSETPLAAFELAASSSPLADTASDTPAGASTAAGAGQPAAAPAPSWWVQALAPSLAAPQPAAPAPGTGGSAQPQGAAAWLHSAPAPRSAQLPASAPAPAVEAGDAPAVYGYAYGYGDGDLAADAPDSEAAGAPVSYEVDPVPDDYREDDWHGYRDCWGDYSCNDHGVCVNGYCACFEGFYGRLCREGCPEGSDRLCACCPSAVFDRGGACCASSPTGNRRPVLDKDGACCMEGRLDACGAPPCQAAFCCFLGQSQRPATFVLRACSDASWLSNTLGGRTMHSCNQGLLFATVVDRQKANVRCDVCAQVSVAAMALPWTLVDTAVQQAASLMETQSAAAAKLTGAAPATACVHELQKCHAQRATSRSEDFVKHEYCCTLAIGCRFGFSTRALCGHQRLLVAASLECTNMQVRRMPRRFEHLLRRLLCKPAHQERNRR